MSNGNLIDINFKDLSIDDKRVAFILMDFTLKKLHLKKMVVTSFHPKDIYVNDGICYFSKVTSKPVYYADNMEKAIYKNILSLSNLAFCAYLPDYDFSQGLLSHEIISDYFDAASGCLSDDDRDYYKSILVDSYKEKKLVSDSIYLYDYINKQNKSEMDKKNSNKLVKATQVGKALTNNEESAFSRTFFLITIVACVTILLGSLFIYFVAT